MGNDLILLSQGSGETGRILIVLAHPLQTFFGRKLANDCFYLEVVELIHLIPDNLGLNHYNGILINGVPIWFLKGSI
jgi:hypothetical protein